MLCGLQATLRAGDVWVPASRRYLDPAGLLIHAARWATQVSDFCTVTGTAADRQLRLETKRVELIL